MMDREKFYDTIRDKVNLTTQNVYGMEQVLSYSELNGIPLRKLAYVLATAWWETAQTMHPVREAFWLSEGWRKRNLRYYPYYGRGLVQTTWKENYEKIGKLLQVDLVNNPDWLLSFEFALPALFVAMEQGLYTGKSLDDYIGVDDADYVNARRIVNGTDKAATIAKLAVNFEKALEASGYEPILELTDEVCPCCGQLISKEVS